MERKEHHILDRFDNRLYSNGDLVARSKVKKIKEALMGQLKMLKPKL